jgi:hypothetical protein
MLAVCKEWLINHAQQQGVQTCQIKDASWWFAALQHLWAKRLPFVTCCVAAALVQPMIASAR